MRVLQEKVQKSQKQSAVFPKAPVIQFKTSTGRCPRCQTQLLVYRTDTRKVYLMDIGEIRAHRTFLHCPDCKTIYPPAAFDKIVAPCSNVGYDVMTFIGKFIVLEHHTVRETLAELKKRSVHISSSEVAYLVNKFILFLSILHQLAGGMLKDYLSQNGGYILHIDGTCEGASPHLISAIDEMSGFVLTNVKIPGESKELVIPFLKQIEEAYGQPLAVTSDMGIAFAGAIAEVFPGVPHYICHFHFLRDIGKDLMDGAYSILRSILKHYSISAKLRNRVSYYFKDELPQISEEDLATLITVPNSSGIEDEQNLKNKCHLLLQWALDWKNSGNGFGFPFDRPYMVFYDRLCIVKDSLSVLQNKCTAGTELSRIITKLLGDLKPVVDNDRCKEVFQQLAERAKVFENLRLALAIAQPDSNEGLNDNGAHLKMKTIKSEVKKFVRGLKKSEGYHENKAYQNLIKQTEKYWDKLFCDSIKVRTSRGVVTIQPQRTNNIMEQFFRSIKRAHRKTTGNNSFAKRLETMPADVPLARNLNNPDYLRLILDGHKSLEEAFAELDHKQVIAKMRDAQNIENRMPQKIKKIIRNEKSMTELLNMIAS